MDRPKWHHSAACSTHPTGDPWFSESPDEIRKARLICAGCPVKVQCREEGQGMSWGVWGGQVRHRVKGIDTRAIVNT